MMNFLAGFGVGFIVGAAALLVFGYWYGRKTGKGVG